MSLTNSWKNSITQSIVFIDSNLEDYQFLADGINKGVEVVILDRARDGIEQINEAIDKLASGQVLIEAIHILSHGSPGSLQLGNIFLNSDNLESYGQVLSSWKNALTNKANILLYGCRVAAENGQEFVGQLQQIIGVNIAATLNLTGSQKLGGNWDLEFNTGEILVPIPLTEVTKENYRGVLATLTVANSNDSGEGSLREAIATAEAGDTIKFAGSLAGQTITLTSGQLEIDKDLIIDGGDAANLTISGNNASRIFETGNRTNVTLKNLIIANGKTNLSGEAGNGGGIRTGFESTLIVENSELNNNVTSGQGGGGIWVSNSTNTTIINSKFDSNDATIGRSERGGGAISTGGLSVLTIENSSFTNNKGINGGAVNAPSTALTVENSIFTNNDTTAGAEISTSSGSPRGFGGAIYTDGVSASFGGENGTTAIRNSQFENNQGAGAGGAAFLFLYPGDNVIIEDTNVLNNSVIFDTFENAHGGGIRLGTGNSSIGRNTPGQFQITNTTFAGNTAESQGGGLWIQPNLDLSRVSVVNSTFSDNKAENEDGTIGLGGAIATFAPTTITNSTITNNSAAQLSGAIYTSERTGFTADIAVSNTIFDRNTAGNENGTDQQTNIQLIDGGGNLQFPAVDNNNALVTANIAIGDPQLEPLQEINGAFVRPLAAGSPAIDAGTNSNAPTTDQRGQERPIDGDGNGSEVTDVGAYEFVNNVAPEPNNPPVVATNQTLTLDEGASSVITNNELQVTDADGDAITFNVNSLPNGGTLQLNNVDLAANDTFTQTDVDSGNLSYNHDGGETTQDSFSLSANDGNGGSTGNIDFQVQVNAVNNPPTDIALDNNNVAENSDNGTVIGQLSTTDPDDGDTHTYILTDDAGGRFAIEGDLIVVADGSNLDFETNDGHNITVQSSDSGTPSNSFEKSFSIAVTDVDEGPSALNLTGTPNDDRLVGGADRDTILGAAGNDTLIGRNQDDLLIGDAGNDNLNGGPGADIMRGGAGNDLYLADNSDDQIEENANEGKDTVRANVTYRLSDNLERLILTGNGDIDGTGNSADNSIAGNEGNNKLVGAAGNDTLWGVSGDDTLIGSRGHDILLGGRGDDFLEGRPGRDRLNGNSGDDTLVGGVGADKFIFNTNQEFASEDLGTDLLTDFKQIHSDRILLDRRTFTAITSDKGEGFSVASEFEVVDSDAAAATSDAFIVYNETNGSLFYNPNGSDNGFGSGDLFAILLDVPLLEESDFLIR